MGPENTAASWPGHARMQCTNANEGNKEGNGDLGTCLMGAIVDALTYRLCVSCLPHSVVLLSEGGEIHFYLMWAIFYCKFLLDNLARVI